MADDDFKSKMIDFWYLEYASTACTLCGNRGVIDTRGVTTPAGVAVGRLNFCPCPNGLALRKQGRMPESYSQDGNKPFPTTPSLPGVRPGCFPDAHAE